MPKEIKRWNSFSVTNTSSNEAKFTYIILNSQTPCPPRGAVPVNQRCCGRLFHSQHRDRLRSWLRQSQLCQTPLFQRRSALSSDRQPTAWRMPPILIWRRSSFLEFKALQLWRQLAMRNAAAQSTPHMVEGSSVEIPGIGLFRAFLAFPASVRNGCARLWVWGRGMRMAPRKEPPAYAPRYGTKPLPAQGPTDNKKAGVSLRPLCHILHSNNRKLYLMRRRRFTPISHTRSDYCAFASSTLNSTYSNPCPLHVTSCGDKAGTQVFAFCQQLNPAPSTVRMA